MFSVLSLFPTDLIICVDFSEYFKKWLLRDVYSVTILAAPTSAVVPVWAVFPVGRYYQRDRKHGCPCQWQWGAVS